MKQKINEFKKWDTHHHISPPFFEEFIIKNGNKDVYGLPHAKWSPKLMLNWMNNINIEKAILSFSLPGIYYGDIAETKAMARKCNEYMAELIKQYPDRLGGFATLPLPDPNASIEELKYALDTLKLEGLGLLSNAGYKYFGDESYEPFWEEVNKRKLVVYVHPVQPEEGVNYTLLNYTYYLKMDTTKTIVDFMRSGYHKKFPDIKFFLSHGGGGMPKVMMSALKGLEKENPNIMNEFEAWRSQLFADTALVGYPDEMLPEVLNFFGANHVIFGTDLCWAPDKYKYFVQQISQLDLSRSAFENLYSNNVKAAFTDKKIPFKPLNVQVTARKRSIGTVNHHVHVNPKKVTEFVTDKLGRTLDMNVKDSEIMEKHNNAMVSMDIPELWQLPAKERREALKLYNQTIAMMKEEAKSKAGVFAAIDLDDPKYSLEEIEYCLKQLDMDGVCLYVKIVGKNYGEMFDEKLLEKLEKINVPVLIHPKDSNAKPVLDFNYHDSLSYMYSLLYLDKLEHMKKVNYIPTHTDGLLDFLARASNSMYYIDPETHKPRIGKIIWELLIKKREVFKDYVKELKHVY